MTLEAILEVKNKMSSHVLSKKKKMARIFSMAGDAENRRSGSTGIKEEMRARVNGVGISQNANEECFVKLFARERLTVSKKMLSAYYNIDPHYVIVKDAGSITFRNFKGRQRPIYPGVSIGHYSVTAGTLGCLVKDEHDNIYVLSNNHVLANCDKCKTDDIILQPGAFDGGHAGDDVVATLAKYIPLQADKINLMDAAIAKVVEGIEYSNQLTYSSGIQRTKEPAFNMYVEKTGRTTGKTQGVIITRSLDIEVDYEGKLYDFEDQFEISGNFSDSGDSGSLIVEQGTNNAVGLLFAGIADGSTFGCPIDAVLSAFSVSII